MSTPSKTYHGPTPVTGDQIKMAKKHLITTIERKEDEHDFNDEKIADHAKDYKKQIKAGNKEAAVYTKEHQVGHEKDNDKLDDEIQERKASMKTLATLKPKTYDDVRKKKVAIISKKADKQNG